MEAAYSPVDIKPDVTSIQNDDVFNKFWLGKVDLPMAIISGQIKAQGAVTDMLNCCPF